MSNSAGLVSFNAQLAIDPAGGSSYATVAEVIEINGPGFKVTAVEMSNLTSPGHAKEKRPGFIDGGQVTFKCTFTKAQYNTLITHLGTSLMTAKLQLPLASGESVSGSAWTFAGHIAELGTAIPEDDRVTNDVTWEVSGLPVFTQGS